MKPLHTQNFTTDLDQSCCDMLRFWPECRVEFTGKDPYYSHVNRLILEKTSFSDNATTLGLFISKLRFDECLLLSIPVKGHSAHHFQGKTWQTGKNKAVLHPEGVEINAWPLSDVRTFQVTISTQYYQKVILAFVGSEHVNQAFGFSDIDLSDKFGRNLAAMSRLMIRWLNSSMYAFIKANLALKSFEHQFVQTLVEQQSQRWSFLDVLPAALPYYIKLTEEYIRSLPQQPVSLAELATVSGVSGRSLQLGFKKYRGYSPMEFGRQIRLDYARKKLLNAKPGETVLEIAMDCGFAHISRFAASYAQRFHELPSETLARNSI